jgi:hypothetical protein
MTATAASREADDLQAKAACIRATAATISDLALWRLYWSEAAELDRQDQANRSSGPRTPAGRP